MSKILRSVKNVTNGYTSAQIKVRNATSNDDSPPSVMDMQDIARISYENHELFEIMAMIDKRLNDKGKNWRHVSKSLKLLDFLVHEGSENVVLWSKDNLYLIKTLREFQYTDETGYDRGAGIRKDAKKLTSLLLDDERLREERKHHRQNRRREPRRPARRDGGRARGGDDDSDILQRVLEESRLTAEDEEAQRRSQRYGNESDEDLRRALALSKEEEDARKRGEQQNLFGASSSAGQDLIDIFDPNPNSSLELYRQQQQQWQQQQLLMQQQQQQQLLQQQQQQALAQQQQNVQYDIFGNPVYPNNTGAILNAYGTGVGSQPTGYQQTGYQQTGYQPTGYQQTGYQQTGYQEQPQSQQPLTPLKTGSKNPFAQPSSNPTPSQSTPSMAQLAAQQQQQQQQQPLRAQKTPSQVDQSHINNLNSLLATGEGIDTFGNVGELRIPAQHTNSQMVSSSGIGLTQVMQQRTGGATANQTGSHNPFFGQAYTGVATTQRIQPAFTGYGFGNAQQSQQAYASSFQNHPPQQGSNNLIDL